MERCFWRTELRTCEMNEDGTATLSLQNGTSMTVTPDAQGIATARIAIGNSLFLQQDNKHNII